MSTPKKSFTMQIDGFKKQSGGQVDSPVKARWEKQVMRSPTKEDIEWKQQQAADRRQQILAEKSTVAKELQKPAPSRTPVKRCPLSPLKKTPKKKQTPKKTASPSLAKVWTSAEVIDATDSFKSTNGPTGPSTPVRKRLEAQWRQYALRQSPTKAQVEAKLSKAAENRQSQWSASQEKAKNSQLPIGQRSVTPKKKPQSKIIGNDSPLPPVWNQCAFEVPIKKEVTYESPAKKRLEKKNPPTSPFRMAENMLNKQAKAAENRDKILSAKKEKAKSLQVLRNSPKKAVK